MRWLVILTVLVGRTGGLEQLLASLAHGKKSINNLQYCYLS